MYAVIGKSWQKASYLLAGGIIYLAGFLIPVSAHAEYVYAQVTGFPALTTGNPATFGFLGIGDLTIERLTDPGDGLTIGNQLRQRKAKCRQATDSHGFATLKPVTKTSRAIVQSQHDVDPDSKAGRSAGLISPATWFWGD